MPRSPTEISDSQDAQHHYIEMRQNPPETTYPWEDAIALFGSESSQQKRSESREILEQLENNDSTAAFLLALYYSRDPNAPKEPLFSCSQSGRTDDGGGATSSQPLTGSCGDYNLARARESFKKCLNDHNFDVPEGLLRGIGFRSKRGEKLPHSLVQCADEAVAKQLILHPNLRRHLSVYDLSVLLKFDGILSTVLEPKNNHPLVDKIAESFRFWMNFKKRKDFIKNLIGFAVLLLIVAGPLTKYSDIPILIDAAVIGAGAFFQLINVVVAGWHNYSHFSALTHALYQGEEYNEKFKLLLGSEKFLSELGGSKADFIYKYGVRGNHNQETTAFVFEQDSLLRYVNLTVIRRELESCLDRHRNCSDSVVDERGPMIRMARAVLDSELMRTRRSSPNPERTWINKIACEIIAECDFGTRDDQKVLLRDLNRLIEVSTFYGMSEQVKELEEWKRQFLPEAVRSVGGSAAVQEVVHPPGTSTGELFVPVGRMGPQNQGPALVSASAALPAAQIPAGPSSQPLNI